MYKPYAYKKLPHFCKRNHFIIFWPDCPTARYNTIYTPGCSKLHSAGHVDGSLGGLVHKDIFFWHRNGDCRPPCCEGKTCKRNWQLMIATFNNWLWGNPPKLPQAIHWPEGFHKLFMYEDGFIYNFSTGFSLTVSRNSAHKSPRSSFIFVLWGMHQFAFQAYAAHWKQCNESWLIAITPALFFTNKHHSSRPLGEKKTNTSAHHRSRQQRQPHSIAAQKQPLLPKAIHASNGLHAAVAHKWHSIPGSRDMVPVRE